MEWRLHLGAHKTATTHLQLTLGAARDELLKRGIDYIPLDRLRPPTDRVLKAERFFRAWKFKRAVSPLMSGASIAILSEENWLGYPFEACRFPPYQDAGTRLGAIKGLGGKFSAFLAIRNPADFAASVYAETMRHDPDKVSLEGVRRAWLEGGSPWFGLVSEITRHFPKLVVWQFEDYATHYRDIATMIAGIKLDWPEIAVPDLTRRLPLETIVSLESLRASDGSAPKAGSLRPPMDGGTRFEMFTPEERLHMTSAYQRDMRRIQDQFPNMLTRF